MRYLIVDVANTFFRARHSAHRQSSAWDKLGFAIHVTLASINKSWRDQKADHVVFCFEGRSWRKNFYIPYKANRAVARAALTEVQQEEDALFWEAFEGLKSFITEKSNCTVLQHSELEADDLIAGWVQQHPNDHHTIISSDTDFYQLLSENVNQYNGIADELHTLNGIFDKRNKLVLDKKTKEPKKIPDPKWILFEKCMRGDTSDNVFSAYPGVRTKGTKNKVGLLEAYEDKEKGGYSWNNLMLQRWTDHNGLEHRVLDDYNRNVTLVDLSAQPTDIKAKIVGTIETNSITIDRPMIGAQFLKFCGKYDLVKLSDNATDYARWLGASYPDKVVDN
jgi:5'-3' exonuclease